METATAAVPTTGPEEDDNLDAMTIAEPEMEVEVDRRVTCDFCQVSLVTSREASRL